MKVFRVLLLSDGNGSRGSRRRCRQDGRMGAESGPGGEELLSSR